VAFPSKEAFVGYAVPLVALRKAHVSVNAVFAGSATPYVGLRGERCLV